MFRRNFLLSDIQEFGQPYMLEVDSRPVASFVRPGLKSRVPPGAQESRNTCMLFVIPESP